MIDLYYWTTPNGHKITIFLEEANLPYQIIPINIGRAEQFDPDFLKISPNNRIPAIVDHQPNDQSTQVALFESGAILIYLAEKTDSFGGKTPSQRYNILQWLMWQMGGLGPMLGQNHHFGTYAPETIPYAIERYQKEALRLYRVMDKQLAQNEFLAGEYSIADMASYPWTLSHERQGIDLEQLPNVKRWIEQIQKRDAVIRAYAQAEKMRQSVSSGTEMDETAKKILFGQTDTKNPAVN